MKPPAPARPELRVRQSDIATRLGLSRQTVSLVMRELPGPSAEARARVLRMAEELGYVADPMLSALSAYRSKTGPAYHGEIAYLHLRFDARRAKPPPDLICQAAAGQAARAGFKLRPVALAPGPLALGRALRSLFQQGVSGLILHSSLADQRQHPGLEPFCCVVEGAMPARLDFPCVLINHYGNMRRALDELRDRGYRRPFFVASPDATQANDDAWLAAFEHHTLLAGLNPRELIYIEGEGPDEAEGRAILARLRARIRDAAPDVVIGFGDWLRAHLVEHGWDVPGRIGYCDFDLTDGSGSCAGLSQPRERLGQVCVDLLQGMILRRERGPRADAFAVELPSRWVDGPSLRPARLSA